MKKYIIIIFITFFGTLNIYSQTFEVTSIDSTSNNFIVMVKNHEKEYLIISPRVKEKKCFTSKNEKIKIGYNYNLLLEEATLFVQTEPNVNNTIYVDDKIVWESGDNYKIYLCENLKGLYFVSRN